MGSQKDAAKAPVPKSVADYAVLPLTLPTPPSFSRTTMHYLYLRPHSPKSADEDEHERADARRKIFIANVPIDSTEERFRDIFHEQLGGSMGGRVERVEFEEERAEAPPLSAKPPQGVQSGNRKRKRGVEELEETLRGDDVALPKVWDQCLRKSGSSAVMVFVDRASADMAMKSVRKAIKSGKEVKWKGSRLGLDRYKQHQTLTYPSPEVLTASINSYLTTFNQVATLKSRTLAKSRTVPDEDGFITVMRGGRAGPAKVEEAEAAKEKQDKKRREGVGENFYRFQVREKRKEKEAELRRKFEEDKKRIQKMREGRGRLKPE